MVISSFATLQNIKELTDIGMVDFSDPHDIELARSRFLDKVQHPQYSVIQNSETGQYCFPMIPFRGNKGYSRKKQKNLLPLIDSFDSSQFVHPVAGSRHSVIRTSQIFLITFTFARSSGTASRTTHGFPVVHWSVPDAWKSITRLINQVKTEFKRIFGAGSYASCLVKEGCANDLYPAPHMILIIDTPQLVYRSGKNWYLGTPNSRALVDKIQSVWERVAGSHCKINPIVDDAGFSYVFKYIQKSVSSDISDFRNMTDSQKVILNTHLCHYLFDTNDIVPKSFCQKLGYEPEPSLLDSTRTKLKHKRNEQKKIIDELRPHLPTIRLNPSLYPLLKSLIAVNREIEQLLIELSQIKKWFFVCGGFSSILSAKIYISELGT